jgi:hypothetical protein
VALLKALDSRLRGNGRWSESNGVLLSRKKGMARAFELALFLKYIENVRNDIAGRGGSILVILNKRIKYKYILSYSARTSV